MEFKKLFNVSLQEVVFKSDARPKEDNSMLKGQSIELDLDEFLGNKSSFYGQDENSKNTSAEMIGQMQTAETPHDFIKIEDTNDESSKR